MKPIAAAVLILGAMTLVAEARLVSVRSYEELEKTSDVIVVARPVATKDTDEKTTLPLLNPDIQVVGVSTEFSVIAGLKGGDGLKELTVHHYRLATTPDAFVLSGPMLASFGSNDPARYLLFLQRESDGRYAPFNQVDPLESSILRLKGTEWDKMTKESFKVWMDAKRWLRERPSPASEPSPEVTAADRAEGSLHEAAMNGKLEKARTLLTAHPDVVNSRASYGDLTRMAVS